MELASDGPLSTQAKYALPQNNLASRYFAGSTTPTEDIGFFRPCSRSVQNHCSSWVWQRDEARRQKESRRAEIDARMAELKKLIDQAMPHDPVAGAMLLRNAHPALGGKRPVEACETQQGFDAVVALLRKTGERAKRRRL